MSKSIQTNFADVLIVCGHGAYHNGSYYSEYPDRDVYLNQAISVKEVVDRFAYTHIVCSGGFTQKAVPDISEAASFQNMWNDTGSTPIGKGVFFDEFSLDSAQNVYLGLMVARQGLGEIPIRRVGVFTAWQFKKRRFNCLATELGIMDRFYFHGLASAAAANSGDGALKGEDMQMARMAQDQDYLLLAADWEEKRQNRYCGCDPQHAERLKHLREEFCHVFEAFDRIGTQRNDVGVRNLQRVFSEQVIYREIS